MGNSDSKAKNKDKSFLLQTCEDHEGSINCMDVSEDGSVIATGSDDSLIRLWTTRTSLVECIGLLEGHEDYITHVLFEDIFLLSSSADKTIRKWNISSCDCVLIFLGHESVVNKIISTGDFLFSVSYDKTARCWDFDTGECVRLFSGHKNNVTSLLFIPAEQETLKDAKKLIELEKKKLAQKGNRLPAINKQAINYTKEDEDDETNIYSKDLIVTGSLDSLAKSWSIETGECIHTFRSHTGPVTCMATDPKGKILFTGSADYSIRSWDIMTGLLLKVYKGHQTTVLSLTTSRKLLYSTSSDHTARCWIMEFGDCARVYKDHTHSVSSLIENDGLVFTSCGDTLARCFDGKSGALKRTFKGHTGSVNCLIAVDKRLFTGGFDGTLRVWDIDNLQAGDAKKDDKKNKKDELNESQGSRVQKMTVENETDFRRSESQSNYNYGNDEYAHTPSQPTRLQVKEHTPSVSPTTRRRENTNNYY